LESIADVKVDGGFWVGLSAAGWGNEVAKSLKKQEERRHFYLVHP
jgi:hypothetical protein